MSFITEEQMIPVLQQQGADVKSLKIAAGFIPEDFGADVASADNTAAINAFIAWNIDNGHLPFWGRENRTFRVTGQLPRFHETKHTGIATIVRNEGGVDYHRRLGPQQGLLNTVHVAPVGTGDGITPGTPSQLQTAFGYWKGQLAHQVGIRHRFSFAAGTYAGDTMRPNDMPALAYPWEFIGPVDGSGVPTAVFDLAGFPSTGVFYRVNDGPAALMHFESLRFDGTRPAIDLRYSVAITCRNLHYYGTKGSAIAFNFRDGTAEFVAGRINGAGTGVMMQRIYGEVGAHSDNIPADGCIIENCTFGVQITRGSICYTRQTTFQNNDLHLLINRQSRCRTQGNTFGAWTQAAIDADMDGLWNIDPDIPDTFPGTTTGLQVIRQRGGSSVDVAYSTVSSVTVDHLRSTTPATINATVKTQYPTGTHSAFRMPGLWLKSPTARGYWSGYILAPTGIGALFEIGASSSSVIASINLPAQSVGGWWHINVDVFGADEGGNTGRYWVRAQFMSNTAPAQAVSNGSFSANTMAIADSTTTTKVFAVYLTPTGAGDFTLRGVDSKVAL